MTLIDVPQYPPAEWATTPIEGWSGGSVKIETTGPNAGRACGLVQPPPGSARYLGAGKFNGAPIPAVYPDETFRDFHCGSWQFTDGEELVTIPVGSIAIGGGHSNQVRASNVTEARDFLQRRQGFSAESDLAVYGTVTRIKDGPHAGGLLFCGAAYPHLTVADAQQFNTTTLSGENWPHPDHNGQMQFIGPARVQRTSFAYDLPMAADVEGGGPVIVCFIDENGEKVCTDCDDTAVMAEPMMAEVDDSVFAEVRRGQEDLVGRVDQIEEALANVELSMMNGDDVTMPAKIDALIERIGNLEIQLEEAKKQQPASAPVAAPAGSSEVATQST